MATTARRKNRYPLGSDAANVPLWMLNLATDLDNAPRDDQGTLANRATAFPTPIRGDRYFATDVGREYRWDDAAWQLVGDVKDGDISNPDISATAAIAESKLNLASDAAAGTASRRTLGPGATQAAQGSALAAAITDYEAAFSTWKPMNWRIAGKTASSIPAGQYALHPETATADITYQALPTFWGFAAIYIDPGNYPAGARTIQMRLRTRILPNLTAPGQDISVALYPITGVGGSAGGQPTVTTLGAAVTGSTMNFTGLTASTRQMQTATFTMPAANDYVVAFNLPGTTNASSIWSIIVDPFYKQLL